MDKHYDAITLFSRYFILKRPRIAMLADIVKVVTMFIKTVFEDSKKVKKIRNYAPKCNLNLYFLI